jgi:hypothetical protein
MKNTKTFTTLLALCLSIAVLAHSLAAFQWAETTHDFGKIRKGTPVTASFAFTNTGSQPLIINKAMGSCGCTGVDYPKEAILPRQKGVIKATFNAAAAGPFSKSVTVESNAASGVIVLHIQGEVVE